MRSKLENYQVANPWGAFEATSLGPLLFPSHLSLPDKNTSLVDNAYPLSYSLTWGVWLGLNGPDSRNANGDWREGAVS